MFTGVEKSDQLKRISAMANALLMTRSITRLKCVNIRTRDGGKSSAVSTSFCDSKRQTNPPLLPTRQFCRLQRRDCVQYSQGLTAASDNPLFSASTLVMFLHQLASAAGCKVSSAAVHFPVKASYEFVFTGPKCVMW